MERRGGDLYRTETGSIRARLADGRTSNRGLGHAVQFPTPVVPDGGGTGRSGKRINEVPTLQGMASRGLWPTPRSHETLDLPKGTRPGNGADNLATAVMRPAVGVYSTPTAQDAKNNGGASQHHRNSDPLNVQAGGALNPDWVEWLMGWPLGATRLTPLDDSTPHTWDFEPESVPRVTEERTGRVARLRMLGNGQVPLCAATAWLMLGGWD